MAFSLLWSWGLVISIIVFALAIGLTLGYGNFSKKDLAKFTVLSVIVIFIMVYAIDLFKTQLTSAIGSYNYLLLFLIALIVMFIGYLANKDYKGNLVKVFGLAYLCFMIAVLICIGSGESLFGLNSLYLALLTAILFNLVMVGVFFICEKFRFIDGSYKTLGSMYFIGGIYFLVVSLFIPNIVSLNMEDMKPINIVSFESIAITLVLLVVIVVLGLFYYKKNTLLK